VDASSAVGVARISSARIVIIASHISEHTTRCRCASVLGTIVVIIASDGDVVASSGGGGASVIGASIRVVTVDGSRESAISGVGVANLGEAEVVLVRCACYE
jgi:hypothetical protein